MSKNKQPGADAETAQAPAPDVSVVVKVLVNGALFNDAHHARGKQMRMPKSKADVLAGMTPPQVAIIGV